MPELAIEIAKLACYIVARSSALDPLTGRSISCTLPDGRYARSLQTLCASS